MKYLLDFFHQKVPKSGNEMPAYYRSALVFSEKVLAVYFLISFGLFYWREKQILFIPIILAALMVLCAFNTEKMSMRMNVAAYSLTTVFWTGWYIYSFGWSIGGQHILLPMLVLVFFNIYDSPVLKIIKWLLIIVYRMLLFAYSLNYAAIYAMDQSTAIIYQTINSLTLFIILAIDFIIFSSSIQDTERELRLNNQELHKEADTDPLTQLPNRRAMLDFIQNFCDTAPDPTFAVAIGDIDFFKKVNDTYGHNCGDFTLQKLAELFREKAGTDYYVCRWGGEEFCFFLPGKNIDEAWSSMFDLCESVRKMKLEFEGNKFSITITIGIEENDFHSSIDTILEKADKKLYMGKVAGRNRVVM